MRRIRWAVFGAILLIVMVGIAICLDRHICLNILYSNGLYFLYFVLLITFFGVVPYVYGIKGITRTSFRKKMILNIPLYVFMIWCAINLNRIYEDKSYSNGNLPRLWRDRVSVKDTKRSCRNYLRTNMQQGDELWHYKTPMRYWRELYGSEGYAIYRDGKIVGRMVFFMN